MIENSLVLSFHFDLQKKFSVQSLWIMLM